MLREYEFTFVIRGDLPDSEKARVIGGYEDLLKREGGEVLKRDDWGAKKLAYPIDKCFRGSYYHYLIATTPANIAESERLIRIDDNVLRHLVIKTRDEVDVEARKQQITAALAQASQA